MSERVNTLTRWQACEDCATSKAQYPFARQFENRSKHPMTRVMWLCKDCARNAHMRQYNRLTQEEIAL